MRILLVGGAGFIGSHVYHNLMHPEEILNDMFEVAGYKYPHDILIVDNLDCYGLMSLHEYSDLVKERLGPEIANVALVNINERETITKTIQSFHPDVVVHLAAYPRAALVDRYPVNGVTTMTTGLKNVLDACAGIASHFVYVSSSMVYGDFPAHAPTVIDSCRPKSAYAIYKLAGEELVHIWADRTGGTATIIRPSAVYGPKDVTERVISLYFDAAIKDKELIVRGAGEVLDFTYIDDIAKGIANAAENRVGGIFNVTSCDPKNLLQAAESIIKIVGSGHIKLESRDIEMPKRGALDNTNSHTVLQIQPTKFYRGLEKYYAWLGNWNSERSSV